ncbi:head-tail joining protein [Bacillus phage Mgbh1]|uniref:Head-tail joining protein n=1 Tax=Bacillus phage Mgbh1 TaxID=1796993 RepID=A0A142F1K3_9CAUD|nr:head-tail joining protein [Bacillus phage Mgbh1]AMQ66660.1 head-tail joining protein [Bacillus phage Mgbh1]
MTTQKPNNTNDRLTQRELIDKAFTYLNAFKRHRALAHIKRNERDYEKANYHEMRAYQTFDSLELSLRAIQRGQRDLDGGDE